MNADEEQELHINEIKEQLLEIKKHENDRQMQLDRLNGKKLPNKEIIEVNMDVI